MLTLKKDLKQRHLEAFEAAFNEQDSTATGQSIIRRMTVDTALKAGWFGDVEPNLGDMTGREIAKLSEEVWALYRDLTNIDPN